MTPPERRLLQHLEVEVVAELRLVRDSADEIDQPMSEWLFDPADVVREQAGLRNLLGAVEAVEQDAGDRPTA